MKVCLTLICLLFLTALQDGETLGNYRGKEGGNITVRCEFGYFGEKRFLCKGTCEGENILIETTEDRDENGRFSIRYEKRDVTKSDLLHVSITDLKPSDSGRYRCRSDTRLITVYDDFDLVVTEDSSEPKWTQRPFLGSTFLPTSTQSQSFSLSPSETIKLSEKPAAAPDLQLYVILSLVVKIILLSTPLVIFCWKRRTTKSKDSAVETENAEKIFTVYS